MVRRVREEIIDEPDVEPVVRRRVVERHVSGGPGYGFGFGPNPAALLVLVLIVVLLLALFFGIR